MLRTKHQINANISNIYFFIIWAHVLDHSGTMAGLFNFGTLLLKARVDWLLHMHRGLSLYRDFPGSKYTFQSCPRTNYWLLKKRLSKTSSSSVTKQEQCAHYLIFNMTTFNIFTGTIHININLNPKRLISEYNQTYRKHTSCYYCPLTKAFVMLAPFSDQKNIIAWLKQSELKYDETDHILIFTLV